MISAALVGLGRWGTRLAEAASGKSAKLRFSHAVNRTPGKNADFASRHGIGMLASLDEALARKDVDAIVLATPHTQHADQVVACAQARKPVFVEKPFTLTLADAKRAVAAAWAAGIVLAAGHNRRFMRPVQELKGLVAGGGLGHILHLEANISGDVRSRYSPGMWRLDSRESPAGGMAAAGIHMLDAMIHLVGPVAAVSARSRRQVLDVTLDDTTMAMLDFACGATGSLATLMATVETTHLRVFGSAGMAEWRGDDSLDIRLIGGAPERRNFPPADSLLAELDAFADAVAGRAPYPVPLEDVCAGIAAFETIVGATSGDRVLEVTRG